MTEIVMPKLSDTMTEGTFGTWLKAVGDPIAKGDILAEVETDKATMALEAFSSGILLEQRVSSGQTVAVGTVIGIIGEPGELPLDRPLTASFPHPETEPGVASPSPDTPTRSSTEPVPTTAGPSVSCAPVVRRRALELGIRLDQVRGNGPGGRILLEDLEASVPSSPEGVAASPVAAPSASPPPDEHPDPTLSDNASRGDEERPLSRMRTAIARTVDESWRTIPHFSVTTDIHMEQAEEMRRELKENEIPVSLNDIFIKASALALRQYPQVNASFLNDTIIFHQEINIGIMVGVPNGLLAPVVKGCQSLSLRQIAELSRQLIERARSNTISEPELRDATFSLSNLGMYGVSHFSALILPPQVAILAIGAVSDAVTLERGVPAVKRVLKATLSADHRALDGICAAEFLNALRRIIENPLQLLLP